MATMYDICAKTGLSTATVSRVINNSSKVSDKTRKVVLNAMKEHGFRPNQAARMLAGKTTDTIGVVLPEIDNGFYVKVLRGINEAVKEANRHLLVSFYENKQSLNEALQTMSTSGRTDAIIVMNSSLSTRTIDQLVKNCGQPVILIGHRSESSELIDIVGIDNINGAARAVSHLLEQGFENLLLLTGPNHYLDSTQRLEGAKLAFACAGKDFSKVRILKAFFDFEGGRQAMNGYLFENPDLPPDALFAFNDQMALGAMDALKEKGFRIPDDIAVIGFDDSEIAQFTDLSTIQVPMHALGYEAASMAIRKIGHDRSVPKSIMLKTSVVVRKSTLIQKSP
jgi:DNA-binding LacI/PurR family transcriptional regulator